ncbi:MAG: hypothetical protein ABI868_02480 [Acidobacteriota bacterium]
MRARWAATVAFLGWAVAWPSVALAQTPPPAPPAAASPAGGNGALEFGKKIFEAFQKPLHPTVKSVAPGGGFGAGIGYKTERAAGEPWWFRSEAVITPRKYWNLEANWTYQSDVLHGELYGRAREMTRLDFYGIGTSTSRDSRTTFRYSDRTAGGLASVRFPSFDVLAVGGRIEGLWPEIGPGRNEDYPSIEQRFTEATAPGLDAQPAFTAYTGFANVNYPGGNALGRYGVDVQLAYSQYQDHQDGHYGFGRWNLESQQRIPAFRPSHLLTLHEWFSTTNTGAGHVVPFYLQHTLGGAGAVRPFNEEILGSDSTKATLRGFQDLRFRGPHLLLLQAEYRFKIKGPVDATVFADGGSIGAVRSDLSLSEMKGNAGFSLSFMTIDATALRLDVGFGGGEGAHVFFSVGPIFQR